MSGIGSNFIGIQSVTNQKTQDLLAKFNADILNTAQKEQEQHETNIPIGLEAIQMGLQNEGLKKFTSGIREKIRQKTLGKIGDKQLRLLKKGGKLLAAAKKGGLKGIAKETLEQLKKGDLTPIDFLDKNGNYEKIFSQLRDKYGSAEEALEKMREKGGLLDILGDKIGGSKIDDIEKALRSQTEEGLDSVVGGARAAAGRAQSAAGGAATKLQEDLEQVGQGRVVGRDEEEEEQEGMSMTEAGEFDGSAATKNADITDLRAGGGIQTELKNAVGDAADAFKNLRMGPQPLSEPRQMPRLQLTPGKLSSVANTIGEKSKQLARLRPPTEEGNFEAFKSGLNKLFAPLARRASGAQQTLRGYNSRRVSSLKSSINDEVGGSVLHANVDRLAGSVPTAFTQAGFSAQEAAAAPAPAAAAPAAAAPAPEVNLDADLEASFAQEPSFYDLESRGIETETALNQGSYAGLERPPDRTDIALPKHLFKPKLRKPIQEVSRTPLETPPSLRPSLIQERQTITSTAKPSSLRSVVEKTPEEQFADDIDRQIRQARITDEQRGGGNKNRLSTEESVFDEPAGASFRDTRSMFQKAKDGFTRLRRKIAPAPKSTPTESAVTKKSSIEFAKEEPTLEQKLKGSLPKNFTPLEEDDAVDSFSNMFQGAGTRFIFKPTPVIEQEGGAGEERGAGEDTGPPKVEIGGWEQDLIDAPAFAEEEETAAQTEGSIARSAGELEGLFGEF